jgi:EpsI family protein
MSGERTGAGRRDVLLGGLLMATAAVTYARLPRNPIIGFSGKALDSAIPLRVGNWTGAANSGFVTAPEDELRAASVYDDQLALGYDNGTDPTVMLLLAYARSQSGMLMIHRPESCYPGSGFTITDDRPIQIGLAPGLVISGRFLSAQREERIEQILYWTRLGNEFPDDWDRERSSLATQNLRGLTPDGALMRLSVISADAAGSLALLRRFAATLFGSSGPQGRALMAGPANRGAGKA